MSRTLRDVASYSKERVPLDDLSTATYVSTNNLLQNKKGKVSADSLPPNGKTVSKFSKGDILIANIRPYLKKIWHATHGGGNSTDVLALEVYEDFNSSFIYYSLLRDIFFEHMMNGSKGTKMPRGDKNQVLDFPIPEFDRPKQDRISKVLSVLDSKIELNKKINEELEAMARLIYDYWFVQFDFPDKNGKPYKSSGGKMEFNKELNREIPEGFRVKELSEIANITMGSSPPGSSYNENGDGEVFFQGSTDFGWRFPSIREFTTKPKRMAEVGDILLSVRAPVGTLNIADHSCCIGRGLAALNSKDDVTSYLFYVMLYLKKIFDLRSAVGTTFGSITKDALHSLKVAYPPNSLLLKFDNLVADFNLKIFLNHQENKRLEDLRDWLLPMLMNGQVSVVEAEQEMSVAAEPEVEYETARKSTNVDYYKRIVLAAEIVWQLHKQPTLGHLKLQKLIYLAQQSSDMTIPTNFLQQAAGPYDPRMARSIDKQIKNKKWFAYNRDELFKYKPLENAGDHKEDFEKYFKAEKEGIQYLIDTFKTAKSGSVEIVATLYACWKEALKNAESVTEELLIQKFYDWSEGKAKYEEERLIKAIDWMREEGIVPTQKLEMNS